MTLRATFVTNILGTVTFCYEGVPRSYLPAGTCAYIYGNDRQGAPTIEYQITGLMYVCPCGCQGVGSLPFYKYDNHDAWNWNGSQLSPTLTPSILRKKTCGWHGYLTDGEWRV